MHIPRRGPRGRGRASRNRRCYGAGVKTALKTPFTHVYVVKTPSEMKGSGLSLGLSDPSSHWQSLRMVLVSAVWNGVPFWQPLANPLSRGGTSASSADPSSHLQSPITRVLVCVPPPPPVVFGMQRIDTSPEVASTVVSTVPGRSPWNSRCRSGQ